MPGLPSPILFCAALSFLRRILRRKPYSWASLPPPPRGASRGLRPRVYVYDLPGYFNTWQGLHSPVLDWEEPVWFLERLLNSPYRTADPDEADFFYIPLFIRYWAPQSVGTRSVCCSEDGTGFDTCDAIRAQSKYTTVCVRNSPVCV